MKRLIAAALLAATATASNAAFFDGNDLLRWHTNGSALFTGYVAAVIDTDRGANTCIPDSVQLSQVRDVVAYGLTANPADRHFSGWSLVLHYAGQAWPCPAKQPQTYPNRDRL